MEPAADSLNSLATAGMSRPLALLKTAALIHSWARARHERTVRAHYVASTGSLPLRSALQALAPRTAERIQHERLLNAADGCERMRRAFAEMRLPAPGEWIALAAEQTSRRAVPAHRHRAHAGPDRSGRAPNSRMMPINPFPLPLKSGASFCRMPSTIPSMSASRSRARSQRFICYVLFIGFDYPGIYTSVITCFVVSVSTIGASNQKGILRFGGAAVGGLMGLIALVYLFPNVETIGGFWLVFGAGTAVAAWVNFGTPRIFYGGYQTGLAFYKAILQDFGPALSATVVRDRLIGVFFGLIVFGIVEHVLWPVSARDALRARLAEMLRLLADLAVARRERAALRRPGDVIDATMWIRGVDGSPRKWRRFRGSSSRPSLSRVIWK